MTDDLHRIERLEGQKTKRAFVDSNLQIQSAQTQQATKGESTNFSEIYQHYMGNEVQATSPYSPTGKVKESETIRKELDEFKTQIDSIAELRKEFETILNNLSELKNFATDTEKKS